MSDELFVAAAYGVAAATIAIWFWMIVLKLRKHRDRSDVR
jgi:hypothetical protein